MQGLLLLTDSVNSINVDVKAAYEKGHSISEDQGASYGYDPEMFEYHTIGAAFAAKPGDALYDRLITRNRYYHTSDSQTRSLNMDYSWEHFFGKKGSFTLQGYTKISGSDEAGF